MTTLFQDLRYALRMLAKNPGFTAVAVLTLALGIGATTAIFSVVYGVLLRSLPYPEAHRLVELRELNAEGGQMNFADPNFADIRSENHSLDGAAEYSAWPESVSGGTEPTRTMTASVSKDFFSVMGVQPLRGRGFGPQDQRFGAAPVALVSFNYWQQNLGAAQDLSSLKLTFGDRAYAVVGVLPPGFRFPFSSDIWIPRELLEVLPSRSAHNWHVLARLRPDVTPAQARADLGGMARRLKQQFGQDTMMVDVSVERLQDTLTRPVRPALLILLGAVGFLLLVACANVVNLMLAQASSRERELAIRAALGAGRLRLVRQFLTEALLLSIFGGALGILAASWGVSALLALAPANLPRVEEISVNLPVLAFALGISLTVAAGLGVLTSLRATAGDPQGALAEGGSGRTGSLRVQRFGRGIVAAQLAITLMLLVGAGLLGRSLLRVLSVNPGFQTGHIVTVDLSLPGVDKDGEQIRRVQFLHGVVARLRNIPGVQEAGGVNGLPLAPDVLPADGTFVMMSPGEKLPTRMEDLEKLFHDPSRTGDADFRAASPGYFRTLEIPLLRGRLFDERDTRDTPHVAVISESLARQKWPNQNPLGQLIEFGNMDGDLRLLTVVGVVGDVRERSLEAPPRPTIYVDDEQRPRTTWQFSLVMRTSGDPAAVISAARQILREMVPEVAPRFRTLDQVLTTSLQSRRFNLTLVGAFAAVALLLAAAGIFGVMAYAVERRTREIGIRLALGAARQDVLRMVLGQALVTVAAGVAAGIFGAWAVSRLVQSLMFQVSPTDPVTFAAVALLLTLVGLAASCVPAWRAARVDPMVALRYE